MARPPTFPTLYEDLKRIDISDLRRWNYLEPGTSRGGVVSWNTDGIVTASVSILVVLSHENPYMELDYFANGTRVKYRVLLVNIPSNLGNGIVWYFLCPETGKRCRKLYLHGTRFLHREAAKGAMYGNQSQSKRWRAFSVVLQVLKLDEPFNRKYAKRYYKSKPTKRFLGYLRRAQRILERADANPLFR
jgi:hypothetical protein